MKIQHTLAILSISTIACMSSADIIDIMGNSSSSIEKTGAQFDGTIEYNYDHEDKGHVIITLTNTSSSDVGGYLTGFLFDIASGDDDREGELEHSSNHRFRNTGEQSANPFGRFDAGAALRRRWNGGGRPSRGLGVGETGIFSFEIEAFDADMLTASSFLGSGNDFAVRFRGLNDGGSDKLIVAPVPTAFLASTSMLGLCLGYRTVRRRA